MSEVETGGGLLRGGAISFGLKAGNAAIAFGLTVMLARSLGAEGYGIYAYTVALVVLMSIPAEGGLPILVVRETAAAQARDDWGGVRGMWQWAAGAALAVSLIVALISAPVAWLLREHFSRIELTAFALALALVPMIVLANLAGAALRGLHRVILGQLPELVLRPAALLVAIAVFLLLVPEAMRADIAVALHTTAALVALIATAVLLQRLWPPQLRAAPPPRYATRRWLTSALPLTLVSAMQVIHQNTDLVMLGFFRPSSDVGIYRVAAQAALVIGFGLNAVNLVVAPRFARHYARGEMQALQRVATRSARLVLALTLPIVLIFVLVAGPIIALVFGEEYRGGETALAILAIGQLANAGFGSVGFLLNMTGHERDTACGMGIAVVVNALLNLALIPFFGLEGAATATAVTLVLWNVLLWRAVRMRLGVDSTALAWRVAGTR
jgi:O-antigen/teichoic acid export membrane protein